jgi:hypothetical protein
MTMSAMAGSNSAALHGLVQCHSLEPSGESLIHQ